MQSASASPAVMTPPPNGDSVIGVQDLPNCGTDIYPAQDAGDYASVGLGWSGAWRTADNSGTVQQEYANVIPCNHGSGTIQVATWQHRILGSGGFFPRGNTVTTAYCLVSGQRTNYELKTDHDDGYTGGIVLLQTGNCPILLRVITKSYQLTGTDVAVDPLLATWLPSQWISDHGDYTPANNIGEVGAGSTAEVPISCVIDNSGADLFEITRSVINSMVAWPGCMLVPVAWDRAGLIPKAWQTSPANTLKQALTAALPGSLSCGVVFEVDFFGSPLRLNTCQVTFVGDFIKNTLAAVIVLGLAVLMWRKIMWAVGSAA